MVGFIHRRFIADFSKLCHTDHYCLPPSPSPLLFLSSSPFFPSLLPSSPPSLSLPTKKCKAKGSHGAEVGPCSQNYALKQMTVVTCGEIRLFHRHRWGCTGLQQLTIFPVSMQ